RVSMWGTMKSSSYVVIAALMFGSGQVAFARDHQELVCSAVAKPKDNGDKIPLFIHFFENRSSDGQSRDETLSTVYQGKLFQAQRVNSTGDFSKDAAIVLKAGTAIRFRGKYTIENTSSGYVM